MGYLTKKQMTCTHELSLQNFMQHKIKQISEYKHNLVDYDQ